MIGSKPVARTLVRLSRFEFLLAGEIPTDFADRPLVFIGIVVPQEVEDREQAPPSFGQRTGYRASGR